MKVVDASVLVEYLAAGRRGEAAREAIRSRPGWLWRRTWSTPRLGTPCAASRAPATSPRSAPQRVSHHLLAERAWALRDNLSFYDALYVALAETLKAPLLTFDARLAQAPGLRAEIELIQAA